MAASDTKIYRVDKFLGLNESADSTTELKLGEASKIENFSITDGYNLALRPGIRKFTPSTATPDAGEDTFSFAWSGYISGRECLLLGTENGALYNYWAQTGSYGALEGLSFTVKRLVQSGEDVYLLAVDNGTGALLVLRTFFDEEEGALGLEETEQGYKNYAYTPLILTNGAPTGGGKELEPLNILADRFRARYTAVEGACDFILPESVTAVETIQTGAAVFEPNDLGEFHAGTHTFTFRSAPSAGAEICFTCVFSDADLLQARQRFLQMPYHEHFNGSTDTRIFFYGDGSNVCYYTAEPAFIDALAGMGLYVPAGNEIAVDFSDSPITSMIRHYSKLLVFKKDGAATIVYEPVTLEDGRIVAGFYLRPVNREFGNDAPAQVVLINNSPRSFTHDSIYEWRVSSSSYRDERYAKCISQPVMKTISGARPEKVTVFDDGQNKTYYVFLNDESGTILVNRYDLEVWTIWRAKLARNVRQCLAFDGKMLFLSDGKLLCFDNAESYDEPAAGEKRDVISAVWESGFMDFGADYLRKYSSQIWLSLLPEAGSNLELTVQTDKRSDYIVKNSNYALLGFGNVDFSDFTFRTWQAPKLQRMKIKVKKFVYYKLIFRVSKPGARATVLGYDQQVRFSSQVK